LPKWVRNWTLVQVFLRDLDELERTLGIMGQAKGVSLVELKRLKRGRWLMKGELDLREIIEVEVDTKEAKFRRERRDITPSL